MVNKFNNNYDISTILMIITLLVMLYFILQNKGFI